MVQIPFTYDDFYYCVQIAELRTSTNNYYKIAEPRQIEKKISVPKKHYIGAIGELAYSKYSGLPIDTEAYTYGDDGTDFKNGVDVKSSMINSCPNLLLKKEFMRDTAKYYVLSWINHDDVYLIGWISKEEFNSKCKVVNYGKGDSLRLDHKLLKPMHLL
jgi:hypothetical protein